MLGTQASYLRDVLRVDRRIVETAWRHSRCANDDKINDASSKLRHQFWPIIESSGSCCVHLVRAGDDADPTLFGGLALKIVDNLQSPPDINPQWRGYTVLGFQYGNASRFEDHAGPGYCFFLRSLLGQLLSSCLSTATFYPQDFPPEVPSPWTATPYGGQGVLVPQPPQDIYRNTQHDAPTQPSIYPYLSRLSGQFVHVLHSLPWGTKVVMIIDGMGHYLHGNEQEVGHVLALLSYVVGVTKLCGNNRLELKVVLVSPLPTSFPIDGLGFERIGLYV